MSLFLFLFLVLPPTVLAQENEISPGDKLVIEGIPPVPASLIEEVSKVALTLAMAFEPVKINYALRRSNHLCMLFLGTALINNSNRGRTP